MLTPPKKKGYDKKKNYHWVNFIYLWEREDRERMKKIDSWDYTKENIWDKVDRMELLMNSGIDALLEEYDKKRFPYLKDLYYDNFSYFQSQSSARKELSNYDFEVYAIPNKYKKPVLISGGEEFYRSGDYKSLPGSWVIVKHKGKYGVIDVRDSENPVLPFIYDKIEGNTTHLTLHKRGLKCHYPISDNPRYKELAPLRLRENFIRFTLSDGRKGWLLKNGEEFLDNE